MTDSSSFLLMRCRCGQWTCERCQAGLRRKAELRILEKIKRMKNPVHVVLSVNAAAYGGSRRRAFDYLEFEGGIRELRRMLRTRKAMQAYWHRGKGWVQVVEFGKDNQNLHYHFVFDCAVDLQNEEQVRAFREVLQSIVDSYETESADPDSGPAPSLGLIEVGVPKSVELTYRSLSQYVMKVRFREDRSGTDPQTGRFPHDIVELIKSKKRWRVYHCGVGNPAQSRKTSAPSSKSRGPYRPARTIGEKVAACGKTEVKLLWQPPKSLASRYRLAPSLQMLGHFQLGHPECSTLAGSSLPDCLVEMLRRFEQREKVGLVCLQEDANFCFRVKQHRDFRAEAFWQATWRAEYTPGASVTTGLTGREVTGQADYGESDSQAFSRLTQRQVGGAAHPLTPNPLILSSGLLQDNSIPIVVPNL